MSHLQNYAEQMGGFDFTLTQRYPKYHIEINYLKRKKQSNLYHSKKQVLPLLESNMQMVLYLQLIPEQQEDLLLSKRIAKRYIILLLIFMLVEQALLLIHSL